MTADAVKRRAVSSAVAASRSARIAMVPHNDRIARWLVRAARLKGMAEHSRFNAESRRTALAQTEELAREIAIELATFNAVQNGLPPTVASNSRVADTRRALAALTVVANDIRAIFYGPRGDA